MMEYRDRERLAVSVFLGLALHGIVFMLAIVLHWGFPEPPPYKGPLYVQLETPPLPQQLPSPPQTVPQEPRPAAEHPEQARPQQPAPQPAPSPPAPSSSAGASASSGGSSQAEASSGEAASPQNYDTPEFLYGRTSGGERQKSAPRDQGVLAPQASATENQATLPDWVNRTMQSSGISTKEMEQSDVTDLAQKIQADPEFEKNLKQVISSLDREAASPGSSSGSQSGSGSAAQEDQTGQAGNQGPGNLSSLAAGRVQWTGPEGRGQPRIDLTFYSSDFGGNVPARTTIVVIFEVNDRGLVVPGSLIFQQRSPYTVVNDKIARAVRQWSFQPKPGAGVETGIFTLVIRREDVR